MIASCQRAVLLRPSEDDLFRSDAYPYLHDTGHDIAHAPAQRLAMLGDQKAIERLYQLYDGKIHYIDHYVGQILDFLRSSGLEDHTLVVLTSDHGELLFSHPEDYQTADHLSLYDANLHIPLIMAGPGIPKGRTINGLASNIDTAPAVLDLTGMPPLDDAQGHSLVPLIQGTKESLNPYIYMEQHDQPPERAVRTLHYKLIRHLWTGKESLFDEDQDPGELHDVIQQQPQVAADLRAHLDEWMKENQSRKDVQLRRIRIYPVHDRWGRLAFGYTTQQWQLQRGLFLDRTGRWLENGTLATCQSHARKMEDFSLLRPAFSRSARHECPFHGRYG